MATVVAGEVMRASGGEVEGVLMLAVGSRPPPGWWEFITSPGAGGFAALVAAALALLGVLLKNRHDRRENVSDREQAAVLARTTRDQATDLARGDEFARRWWQLATWAWESRAMLGLANTVELLEVLDDEAHTRGQKAIVTAILSTLREEES